MFCSSQRSQADIAICCFLVLVLSGLLPKTAGSNHYMKTLKKVYIFFFSPLFVMLDVPKILYRTDWKESNGSHSKGRYLPFLQGIGTDQKNCGSHRFMVCGVSQTRKPLKLNSFKNHFVVFK